MANANSLSLVVQGPSRCPTCGEFHEGDAKVTVESIEAAEGGVWKLRGNGRVLICCDMCNRMFEALEARIPIECKNLACPDCGEIQDLKYQVRKIDSNGESFSFEAEIHCPKCKRKKSLVKALSELFKLKKLEVKLTGISIER